MTPESTAEAGAGGEDDGARRQEKRILGQGMEDHLQKRGLDAIRRQQHQAEQHIGHLAHRGIGQPPLQLLFPIGQHGPHEHRGQRQRQQHILGPAARQKLRSKHIISNPDHSHHATLGNDTGEHG